MPPLNSVKEIMRYLDIKTRTAFYNRVRLGLPVINISGRIVTTTELIDQWIATLIRNRDKKNTRL